MMRIVILLVMVLLSSCKTTSPITEKITSGPPRLYTLDSNLDDCEISLNALRRFSFLRVQDGEDSSDDNSEAKQFRKYEVLTAALSTNSIELKKVNLNCIVGLDANELNQYFSEEICSKSPIFQDWKNARVVFTGLFYNVFVDIEEGRVVRVKDGFIVSH